MDVLWKGGALLAAQAEGAARLCVALPLALAYNASLAASALRCRPTAATASPSSQPSRCPFSGLVGGAASCPGARMAAAAEAAKAAALGASAAPLAGGGDAATNDANGSAVTWVEGRVTHVRRRPARHSFAYDVRLALIDLDNPPAWFASQQKDHLSAGEARAAAGTSGRVLLLTLPAAAGYVQNPISVYYCYDGIGGEETRKQQQQGATTTTTTTTTSTTPPLRRCIAEVTNTPWGERVSFVFDPKGATVPKSLHVSPFMDMRNVWLLKATDPMMMLGVAPAKGGGGDDNNAAAPSPVVLSVLVDHPELGRYFDAQFVGKVVVVNDKHEDGRSERSGLAALWRYGFLPQRVAAWIYTHAVLLALKGVQVQPKPAFEAYAPRAEDALLLLRKEEKDGGGGGGGSSPPPIPAGAKSGVAGWAGRPYVWRPALRWPWYT